MRRWAWWVWLLLPVVGTLFAYRMTQAPTRIETAAFFILIFIVPTLRYPRFGAYYLIAVPLFIPLFRRMYYLVHARPTLDYLMLIGDGVMGGFILALTMMWVLRKERIHDPLTRWLLIYEALLFGKIFFLNQGGVVEGLYGYKFNGLFVLFYFAGSYVLEGHAEIRKILNFGGWMLAVTAVYGIKQFLFGFTSFEQRWLDSITFTTLRIDGVVRIFSTYVSPAAMADGMSILLLLGSWALMRKSLLGRFQGLVFSALSVAPLVLATVRTSWAAAAAGLLFFWCFLRLRQGWLRWTLFVLVLVSVVVYATHSDSTADTQNTAFAHDLSAGKESKTDILITNRTEALANPLGEYSIQKRFQIWQEIWYFAVRNPLGRGQGTNGYAHSYYFQVLGEIGFPGLFVFLVLIFLGFKRGFQIVRQTRDPEVAETARFGMTLLFVFSILNLTGTHLHSNPGNVYFWFTLGMLAQLYRRCREEAPAPQPEPAAVRPAPWAVARMAGGERG